MRFLLLPLLLFLLWIPFSSSVDMKIASSFYGVDGFSYSKNPHDLLVSLLISYGNIPGHVLTVGAAGLWLFTFYRPSWQRVRTAALTITLVGSCACVGILAIKQVYGRPRPREVVQFGGAEKFRPVYAPTWSVPNDHYKSFPSGHVGMAMVFVTLGLVGWKERWYLLATFGFLFGVPFALMLAYVRMAEGAHFLSDVLTALVGVWTLSALLVMVLYSNKSPKTLSKKGAQSVTKTSKKAR